ncbi:hypothetical protein OM418_06835 [Enterobacter quasiroggenkampii]|uniref:Uncharacterized protein n=1 Tax=Enterobacter quasiroggenkampii TaxID=2497436 RepID=A0ABY8EC94_9ENTR|nr:hypothetical protein [Enterobacter quasiroggenkampii]WFC84781.1 hypothetical protein OM418_06835 [Enterobacter quasiroggenkampii]
MCSAFYDVGWKHSCPTKNSRSPRHQNDHALCTPGP